MNGPDCFIHLLLFCRPAFHFCSLGKNNGWLERVKVEIKSVKYGTNANATVLCMQIGLSALVAYSTANTYRVRKDNVDLMEYERQFFCCFHFGRYHYIPGMKLSANPFSRPVEGNVLIYLFFLILFLLLKIRMRSPWLIFFVHMHVSRVRNGYGISNNIASIYI